MFLQEKKRKKWPYVLLGIAVFFVGGAALAINWVKHLSPKDIYESAFVQETVVKRLTSNQSEIFNLMPILLGFSEPQTYLFLFQNNTELRPGGGFIGVYSVVRVSNGQVEILALEGTEVLDKKTPDTWKPERPDPITRYLGTDRWYFRDSNWSPDFKVNALRAMEFYKGEGGVAADEIDAVIAITPTVLERLMTITGPFTIQGIEFTAENVIEKLEYEVEYGFEDKGVEYSDRKQIIRPFMLALLDHAKKDVFGRYQEYLNIALQLADEKHAVAYFVDDKVQTRLEKQEWTGELTPYNNGDYLLWVDANLAALKTDHAMKRTINYEILGKQNDGRYLAKATMKYDHQGTFDWRTSRYLTYARVFVPQGSSLVGVEGVMKTPLSLDAVDSGEELGRTWFGTYYTLEPGEKKELSFTYLLPASVTEMIDAGTYTLMIDKQTGTIDHGLTLNLDFDITVTGANPAEVEREQGDTVYRYGTDLRTDRAVTVRF